MLKATILRILVIIPSIFVASIMIFALVYLIPGDAASSIAGPEATLDQIDALRAKLGLDQPPVEQYFTWLGHIFQGDLGTSFVNNANVADQIALRLPITFELALWAFGLALVIGTITGVVAAIYRGGLLDKIILRLTGLGLAVPEFWVAMIAIAVLAVQLGIFPAVGIVPWSAGWAEHLRSIFLPSLMLSIGGSAIIARITRNSMIEVLSSSYIRTEWALGLGRGKIYSAFALKNVSIPVITATGLVLSQLLGGTVLIETVFNIPGMGSFIVSSALVKDIPAIQASLLIVVLLVMLLNLVIDLSYRVLDPRTIGARR